MHTSLKIAVASVCSLPGDVEGNLKKIGDIARSAAQSGCEFLLTPEMSASGYGGYPEVLATAEEAGKGPIFSGLKKIAEESGLTVAAGFAEKEGEKNYIAHYCVFPDGNFCVTRKHRVTPAEFPLTPAVRLYYDETEEIGHVYEGEERFTLFTVKGIPCAIVICADWGIKDILGKLQRRGVRFVMLVTGAGGKREDRYSLAELRDKNNAELRKRYLAEMQHCNPDGMLFECLDRNMAFACCNLVGFDGKKYYHGGSGKIVGSNGELLFSLPGIPVIENMRSVFGFAQVDLDI